MPKFGSRSWLRPRTKKKVELSLRQAGYFPTEAWIVVPHVSDRQFWSRFEKTLFTKNLLTKHAKRALETAPVMPSRELYMEFVTNGNRNHYEKAYTPITQGFINLTLALCLTGDKEKYLARWNDYAMVLAKMPTWVLPAHDRELKNLTGTAPHLELVGTSVAADITFARMVLKGWIPQETDKALAAAVERQIIQPFMKMIKGQRTPDWFAAASSNWNAVCFANLMRCILATEMSAADKKLCFQYILLNSQNYLKGFGKDGYCSEGISYWDYGFGHYLILASTVYGATRGKVNLLLDPAARKAATFPERFMLSPQHYPAFADSTFNARIGEVHSFLVNYLLNKPTGDPMLIASNATYQCLAWGLPEIPAGTRPTVKEERCSRFDEANVYVFRSANLNALRLALKGGHNNELHNHNDVGSYTLAYPGCLSTVGDAGGAVYTRQSFSKDRYKDPILASYGHPVPCIGGQGQRAGREYQAQLVRFANDAQQAEVCLDIRDAYPDVPSLKKLERQFQYHYADGQATITDTVELGEAQTMEFPIITFGEITQETDGTLKVVHDHTEIRIRVDAAGLSWTLEREVIPSDVHWHCKAKRFAIVLKDKQRKATVKMTFSSVPPKR